MSSTKIRTLNLENDVIELHYNPSLKKRPYLVRVFSYFSIEPTELRLEEHEVKNLYQTLKKAKLL